VSSEPKRTTLKVDADSAEFWDRAAGGELVVRWCTSCDRPFHYPRPFCPRCWSTDIEWRATSGRATVYAITVIRQNGAPPFNERLPYAVALVDLDEGVRLLANIEGDPDTVKIGQAVELTFREEDGLAVPVFRPTSAS
jgi:uncharacterized protein